jgi:hypothetical protein
MRASTVPGLEGWWQLVLPQLFLAIGSPCSTRGVHCAKVRKPSYEMKVLSNPYAELNSKALFIFSCRYPDFFCLRTHVKASLASVSDLCVRAVMKGGGRVKACPAGRLWAEGR